MTPIRFDVGAGVVARAAEDGRDARRYIVESKTR
jgi:hypothetical protein